MKIQSMHVDIKLEELTVAQSLPDKAQRNERAELHGRKMGLKRDKIL